jgi:long-subunit acyl-CoA synthetase (AMP-forming)
MLVNRPEFHLVDAAAMHLGATPFSLYNSSSAAQTATLLGDAVPKVVVTETAFLETIERARAGCPSIEHVFVVDGNPSLRELAQAGAADFDFDATTGEKPLVQRFIDGEDRGAAQMMLDTFEHFVPGWISPERASALPAPPT